MRMRHRKTARIEAQYKCEIEHGNSTSQPGHRRKISSSNFFTLTTKSVKRNLIPDFFQFCIWYTLFIASVSDWHGPVPSPLIFLLWVQCQRSWTSLQTADMFSFRQLLTFLIVVLCRTCYLHRIFRREIHFVLLLLCFRILLIEVSDYTSV